MFVRSIAKTFEMYSVPVPECGCWLWTGSKDKDGYGQLMLGGKRKKAHRVAYEQGRGAIPDGMSVCHKCDTPACVNPEHLFLDTQAGNVRDCRAKNRNRNQNHERTHCKNGHPLSDDNVKIEVTGFRRCQTCRRAYLKTYDSRRS